MSQVNRPSHYNATEYEVVEVLDAWFPKSPAEWRIVKYIARSAHKGNLLQDLRKAHWYLTRLLGQLYGLDGESLRYLQQKVYNILEPDSINVIKKAAGGDHI